MCLQLLFTDTEIVTPLARDCEALYQLGFKAPGIYRIDPTGLQSSSSAVQVHCKNGWTLVLKRDHLANDKVTFQSIYFKTCNFAL